MNKVPGQYKHKEIEKKWQDIWLRNKTYKWNPDAPRKDNYVIDTPPPTVSGMLHMGHVYSYTQTDIIARYQRMKGKNVFYPMGFDDNGLPTERLVEKVKKIKPHQIGRDEFRKTCYEVVDEAEKEFFNLFNSLALSVDWDQKYQTISNHCRKISQMSFLDLYHKGECYRTMEPVLWDPTDNTALAQADIEDKQLDGDMNYIDFFTHDGQKHVIATTRPELLPACVAVLYNPADKRYAGLKGKNMLTPLFNAEVPLIADDNVDIDKGTGLVMCCTFGDTTDIEWWKKHALPLKVIIDKFGKLRIRGRDLELGIREDNSISNIIDKLEGLKVTAAREAIIEILKTERLLEKQEKITKNVKCAERSGSPIEIQVLPQWFIKLLDKKEELKKKARESKWFPQHMLVRLENWVDGLNWDWCISRQRYFGVPLPVWYSKKQGEEGKIIVATSEQLPVDPLTDLPEGYTRDEIEPELDIMDTWATSSVTPQINSHAINETSLINYERHSKLYPADLRPQAHEIIRTWAFYTIAKSLLHENTAPWKNVMISGWCLDKNKAKMSKSKGNVVTPMNLIENKGSDVVRYWSATSKLGADIVYSEPLLDVGKRLMTKLWNASKFVSAHLADINHDSINLNEVARIMDRWLISRLHRTIAKTTLAFEQYEYFEARRAMEKFFWDDLCDNYLEIVKTRIYNQQASDNEGQKSAQITLSYTMEILLRLFAPIIPHITEELYYTIFPEYQTKGSIHRMGNWPNIDQKAEYSKENELGNLFVEILELVRKAKAEKKVSIKYPIDKLIISIPSDIKELFKGEILTDLQNVTTSQIICLTNELSKNELANLCVYENNYIRLAIEFSANEN